MDEVCPCIMPRCGRIRKFIREWSESGRIEKLSFIPPFLILILEIILLVHAITAENLPENLIIIELTLILVVISLIEIVLVGKEIHEHYMENYYERVLTIRLDDFITQQRQTNVKKIVELFIKKYPMYSAKRNQIYHISCQILETHKEEEWEESLLDTLKNFIKKSQYNNVDDLLKAFLEKHPKYKKSRGEVYKTICQILGQQNKDS